MNIMKNRPYTVDQVHTIISNCTGDTEDATNNWLMEKRKQKDHPTIISITFNMMPGYVEGRTHHLPVYQSVIHYQTTIENDQKQNK